MFRMIMILSLWVLSTSLLAQDFASLLANASPEKGKNIAQACQTCHVLDQSEAVKFGPPLYGVVGRQIASVSGYDYSAAMAGQSGNWDFERLNKFLAAPMQVVPGTKMAYPGITTAADRAAVIAWLRLQSNSPLALPKFVPSAPPSIKKPEDIPAEMKLLPEGAGRETVFYVCNACHSVKLVVQQGMDRDSWEETLAWMVEEQGMNALDDDTLNLILTYLSENLGIDSHKN